MHQLPILIVGAGPTGLMMACELARHHIPFRIIDKKPESTTGSNATWVQTRTIEIFNLIGMADSLLKIGHKCNAINFYNNGKEVTKIPLSEIDSIYPFILMLPQRELEKLLTKKLEENKIQIERSIELINIKRTNNGMTSTVRFSNGNMEDISSQWVIACDGANSTIRDKCQLSFPGKDIPEQCMVADAKMSSFLPTDEIHVFFEKGSIIPGKRTIFSAFPLEDKEYRLMANLYLSHPRQSFTEHEVKEVVAERTYGNYLVEDVSWISPFWIHSKVVDNMCHNSIFLAGDAAHIHSPAGGQGMNSGLQDAYNLAWKLALVVQQKAKPALLESYQLERHPVVSKIVKKTEDLTQMVLFDKTFDSSLLKFKKRLSRPKTAKKIGMELTQLSIKYQDSPIIKHTFTTKSPRQGVRAPNVILDDSKQLYDYFRNPKHNILLFTGIKHKNKDLSNVQKIYENLNQNFADFSHSFIVSKEKISEHDNILDPNLLIHSQYDIKDCAILVIRPDNHIGYYSRKMNINLLEKFLSRYLIF